MANTPEILKTIQEDARECGVSRFKDLAAHFVESRNMEALEAMNRGAKEQQKSGDPGGTSSEDFGGGSWGPNAAYKAGDAKQDVIKESIKKIKAEERSELISAFIAAGSKEPGHISQKPVDGKTLEQSVKELEEKVASLQAKPARAPKAK